MMPILEPVTPSPHLHAFTGYGIELEYMIVDAESLAVRPIADTLLADSAGEVVNEVEHGPLAWSNELVLHVIEVKTNGPAPALAGLDRDFHAGVAEVNRLLRPHGARLLSTAMHPLFDPLTETRLWSHGQNEIYAAYDRIFGCAGHGWSNLQSAHINLPFFDDAEFTRLHAAIRLALPLIPALAASSPLEAGRPVWPDTRLKYYRENQRAVGEISGQVIPEPVASIEDYHERILAPMYAAIAPHDPDGILAEDWLNSRGAIARFERQTIEIRIIDIQECPAADLAVAAAVVGLVRAFYEERWIEFAAQQAISTRALADWLFDCAARGAGARLEDPDLLAAFGRSTPLVSGELWRWLLDAGRVVPEASQAELDAMLRRGSLAEAILGQTGTRPDPATIRAVYAELADCLADNRLFAP